MTVTGDDALVGRVLEGRYRIESRIARGGMATVFLATDERLDRAVALKVMHANMADASTGDGADDEFTNRFVSEARAAAKLNHRNVVSVFDQGRDGDVVYLVMEFVAGRTLRDVMRDEAPMHPLRAVRIIEQVLIALSAAHSANLIHRDVKPENVLITPDGDVKVADFGLARAVSAATTATGGTLIGTVSYLAPEIVLHEGVDARCDVYAAGAVLYEMLTGRKPHTGDSPIQVAYKHVHDDIGPPSALVPGLPDYIDALIARATVRDRDLRSADARVLLQQVRSVRQALEAAVPSDRQLTADLLPAARNEDVEHTAPVATAPALAVARPVSATTASMSDGPGTEATIPWASTPPTSPPVNYHSNGAATRADPGLHPPMTPDDYRALQAQHHRPRRGKVMLLTVVAAALLLGLAGWWFADGRYTEAPSLVGTAEAKAKQVAERDGFTFRVSERQFSETVAAGRVIETDPEPGGKILPNGTIGAVISKGKDRVTIPDNLARMTIDDANAALDKVDLVVGEKVERYHNNVTRGLVIGAVSIKPDEPLKRGTVVDLAVSRGPKPISITDWVGKPYAQAKAAIEEAGLVVVANSEFSNDVAKGLVLRQNPSSGTLYRGDTIRFAVSKGRDEVEVPDVVGMRRSEAGQVLRAAGFKVTALALPGDWKVRAQSPRGKSNVRRGTTVALSPVGF